MMTPSYAQLPRLWSAVRCGEDADHTLTQQEIAEPRLIPSFLCRSSSSHTLLYEMAGPPVADKNGKAIADDGSVYTPKNILITGGAGFM